MTYVERAGAGGEGKTQTHPSTEEREMCGRSGGQVGVSARHVRKVEVDGEEREGPSPSP